MLLGLISFKTHLLLNVEILKKSMESETKPDRLMITERKNIILSDLAKAISAIQWGPEIRQGLKVGLYTPEWNGYPTIMLGGELTDISYTFGNKDRHFYIFRTTGNGEIRVTSIGKARVEIMHQETGNPYISMPARNFGRDSEVRIGF